MRALSILIFLCAAATVPATAATEFVRIWHEWRDADHFDRISEYFTGEERLSRIPVLRTHRQSREGYYFTLHLKTDTAVPQGKFVVEVIRPDHPEPKVYTFQASLPAKDTALQLGLTGADWPGGRKASPVAWKISLHSADGKLLAEHKSFLWEKPAK
ncbi:MAG: hypothetical protein HZC55_03900 [Verrucomicrobia bacterium]|nr:hypothetical protein [Verrucomicrobiota bacterium]